MKRNPLTVISILVICFSLACPREANDKAGESGAAVDRQKVAENAPMVTVPAGEFMMGADKSVDKGCSSDEMPYHKVYLDAFHIDKYEVTVNQYKECVDADKCSPPESGNDDRDCNWEHSNRGNHPVNCVNWNQAKAYCKYAGKRLPTEAEWEKAARGTDGRKYPWGIRKPTCTYAVMWDFEGGCNKKHTWPVGSKPKGASPYGAMDMAGNVREWCSDWYDRHYYEDSPSRNPTGPASGEKRVTRDGSWSSNPYSLRSASRYADKPDTGYDDLGFRCAKTP